MNNSVLPAGIDFDNAPMYLKKKRKEFGLTQDEFAKLFDLSGDCYRKYETKQRGLNEVMFRMMKLLITEYEKSRNAESMKCILSSSYLEILRKECINSIFRTENAEIVNLVFDYIIRNVKVTEEEITNR